MKWQCPTCRVPVRVLEGADDFPVRCDRCRSYILARATPGPGDAAPTPRVHLVPDGPVAERPSAAGPHLEELLTRKNPGNRPLADAASLAGIARQRNSSPSSPNPPARSPHRTRSARGSALLWILLAAAVVMAVAILAGLRLRAVTASVAEAEPVAPAAFDSVRPISMLQHPAAPSKNPHPVAPMPNPNASPAETPAGNGELFPDIKPH